MANELVDLQQKYNELQRLDNIIKSMKGIVNHEIMHNNTLYPHRTLEDQVVSKCKVTIGLSEEEESFVKLLLKQKDIQH